MQKITRPQFEIESIICLESSFKRERIFDISKEISIDLNIDKSINLECDPQIEGGLPTIVVELITKVIGLQDNETQVYECDVRTVGVFVESGTGNLERDKFANINAPAIIYSFVREYISNLSLKAGLSVLLPPINFVQFNDVPKEI